MLACVCESKRLLVLACVWRAGDCWCLLVFARASDYYCIIEDTVVERILKRLPQQTINIGLYPYTILYTHIQHYILIYGTKYPLIRHYIPICTARYTHTLHYIGSIYTCNTANTGLIFIVCRDSMLKCSNFDQWDITDRCSRFTKQYLIIFLRKEH